MGRFAYCFDKHPRGGWRTARLSCAKADASAEQSGAHFTPEVGSNLFSLMVDGIDYLYDMAPEAPRLLGTPILYPMPNRVRGAQFTFAEHTWKFPPNASGNYIHGLVREEPWACAEPVVSEDRVSVTTSISFSPGHKIYDLYPVRNTLQLTLTLKPNAIRYDFLVRNEDERQALPFGLAIHPYFRIMGARESVRLLVPAQKWMEARELLPTGRLIDMADGPADLRQATSLAALNLDDVFWGLTPDKPQVIYYDALGKKVTLATSDLFTHSVIYTPQGKPFFCVENQSCSTDAHNLYARGLEKEAHLTILKPGETHTSWIEISVSDQ